MLYEIHGEEKRTSIPFDQMSEILRAATISAEDQSFYQNPGVDFKAVARAAIYDILGQKREPGRIDHHPAAHQKHRADQRKNFHPQSERSDLVRRTRTKIFKRRNS